MNKRATRQARTAFAALGICLLLEVSTSYGPPVEKHSHSF